MNISPTSRRFRRSLVILITWIALYIVVSATFNGFLIPFLMDIGVDISAYTGYINIGFALIFGYMIVRSVANTIYW